MTSFIKKNNLIIYFSLALLLACVFTGCRQETEQPTEAPTESAEETTAEAEKYTLDLSTYGFRVEFAGNVAGTFLEDGSDEPLSSVFALKVKNLMNFPLQYAEIHVTSEGETYDFTLSTLPEGESLVCEEIHKKEYKGEGKDLVATMENVTWFYAPLSLCEDVFEVTVTDQNIVLRNKTDQAITGAVSVYYKYYDGEKYLGGITYRATFQDGIGAGATQVQFASHMSKTGSKIMFINYVP